jgi:hypothetical protein
MYITFCYYEYSYTFTSIVDTAGNTLFCVLYAVLHGTEDCTCNKWLSDSKTIELFRVSASRTELRCSRCHGLMGWWDEPPRTKKIMPFKRAWSEAECLAMR